MEPPQLQIVCDTLYDLLGPGETTIQLSHYEELGEAREILGGYLERVLRPSPAEEEAHQGGSQGSRHLGRNPDHGPSRGGRPVGGGVRRNGTPILRELSNRRLVRGATHDEGHWYELTHEYLVEEIRGWLSEKNSRSERGEEAPGAGAT